MPHILTKLLLYCSPLFHNRRHGVLPLPARHGPSPRPTPAAGTPQNYEEALRIAETREREVRGYFDKFDLDGSDTIDMEVRSAPQCTARCFAVLCIARCIAPCIAR